MPVKSNMGTPAVAAVVVAAGAVVEEAVEAGCAGSCRLLVRRAKGLSLGVGGLVSLLPVAPTLTVLVTTPAAAEVPTAGVGAKGGGCRLGRRPAKGLLGVGSVLLPSTAGGAVDEAEDGAAAGGGCRLGRRVANGLLGDGARTVVVTTGAAAIAGATVGIGAAVAGVAIDADVADVATFRGGETLTVGVTSVGAIVESEEVEGARMAVGVAACGVVGSSTNALKPSCCGVVGTVRGVVWTRAVSSGKEVNATAGPFGEERGRGVTLLR